MERLGVKVRCLSWVLLPFLITRKAVGWSLVKLALQMLILGLSGTCMASHECLCSLKFMY